MSQDEKKELTPEEQLTKMQHILSKQVRRRKMLRRKLKKARARCYGALRDDPKQEKVHTRRFIFEHDQLYDELQEVLGKVEWAKRMLDILDIKANTRQVLVRDRLDGELEQHIELRQKPFANLKKMLAATG